MRTEAIELVGLSGFETKYPKQLSGGMKMRASLARSLVLDPSVFLFDEPFGAVDEITRERLNDEVIELFQREGFAGLFITHSISEAVFLSTRVLVMSARPGRIVADFAVPFAYPALARPALRARVRRAERPDLPRAARSPLMSMSAAAKGVRDDPDPTSPSISSDRATKRTFEISRFIGPPIVLIVFVALWQYFHESGLRRFFDKPGFLLPSPSR